MFRPGRPGRPGEMPAAAPPPVFSFDIELGEEADLALEVEDGPPDESLPVEDLPAEQRAVLLARAEALAAQPADERKFFVRDASMPAPKTGRIVEAPFPPPEEARPQETVDLEALARRAKELAGPVEVLRSSPTGELRRTAAVATLTFNQAMVDLAEVGETNERIKASIAPAVAGRWHWTGTTTLQFEAEHRFPFATVFSISVPAGTQSVLGNGLASTYSFEFATPAARLLHGMPTMRPVETLEPTLVCIFDQRVDPQAVLKELRVEVEGMGFESVGGELSLVPHADVEGLDEFKHTIRQLATQGRDQWVAFRAAEPLPKASIISVRLCKIPSAEGPACGAEASFDFKTYSPLELTSWPKDAVHPGTPWTLGFSNRLLQSSVSKASFEISPAAEFDLTTPGADKEPSAQVVINCTSAENTTYTVKIRGLRDIHGQELASKTEVKIQVLEAVKEGSLQGTTGMLVVDPENRPVKYTAVVANHPSMFITVYKVAPEAAVFASTMQQFATKTRSSGLDPIVAHAGTTKVLQEERKLVNKPNIPQVIEVDLQPYLSERGFGHFVVVVKTAKRGESRATELRAWLQVTNTAMTIVDDQHGHVAAYVSELHTGAAVPGAVITLASEGGKGSEEDSWVANELGVVSLRRPSANRRDTLIATRSNGDSAVVDIRTRINQNRDRMVFHTFDDRKLYKPKEEVIIKGFVRNIVIVDKAVVPQFPPAGTCSVKVVDSRRAVIAEIADVPVVNGAFHVKFTLPDSCNLGPASATFRFQNGPRPSSHYHSFDIQEFRRPEFTTSCGYRPTTNHFSSDTTNGEAVATVTASYYSGGGLAGCETQWSVTADSANYSPPGWSGFHFGNAGGIQPMRRFGGFGGFNSKVHYGDWSLQGVSDAQGEHQLRVAFRGASANAEPIMVSCTANVCDLNQQVQSASTNILVHPARLYLGMKQPRWGKAGEPMAITTVVTDVAGDAVPDVDIEVTVTATFSERVVSEAGIASWVEREEKETLAWKSAAEPVEQEYTPSRGGQFSFELAVRDQDGSKNSTQQSMYIQHVRPETAMANAGLIRGGHLPADQVTLELDKESYEVGDTAQLLVQTPFLPARGVLIIACGPVEEERPFEMEEASITLPIPVRQAWICNAQIAVFLVGSKPRGDDPADPSVRPAYGFSQRPLPVSNRSKHLSVDISPSEGQQSPGADVAVTVSVADASGSPVAGAEVTLIAVDESVLALTGYTLGKFQALDCFYHTRHFHVGLTDSRQQVVLYDKAGIETFKDSIIQELERHLQIEELGATLGAPMALACAASPRAGGATFGAQAMKRSRKARVAPEMAMDMAMSGADDAGTASAEGPAIAVRSDFRALATFNAVERTGADGKVQVAFQLPDSLTRYRIWAVTATESLFGLGEAAMTARLPLMVRPSPPRFMSYGDSARLPVVLQNQTDEPLTVMIAAQATNATIEGSSGYMTTVPPGKRGVVSFPCQTKEAGTARFQFVGTAGDFADAAKVEFPVLTPCTSEAFATYGDVVGTDEVVVQTVRVPADSIPAFGGLAVSLSSTALQALTDAVIYLHGYPFGCTEQLTSRMLGIVSLMDVLTAFGSESLPAPEVLRASVEADLAKLAQRQMPDGGLVCWPGGHRVSAYMTVHAAHAVAVCLEKDFVIPGRLQTGLVKYCAGVEAHVTKFSRTTQASLIAYALFAQTRLKQDVSKRAAAALTEYGMDGFSLEALGWLLVSLQPELHAQEASEPLVSRLLGMVGLGSRPGEVPSGLVQDILKHLKAQVNETAETANFITSYGDDGQTVMLHSNRRTDAVLLHALLITEPSSDLNVKLAKGLLAHKTKGAWRNTQENCFVLIALDLYFRIKESAEPDFAVASWLGGAYGGTQAMKGRSTETIVTHIPMQALCEEVAKEDAADGTTRLVLSKTGPGRCYYRLGLSYAPANARLPPANYGFQVTRSYERVGAAGSVEQTADGVWVVGLGTTVRVTVNMVTTSRRYHVALVDKLPAGFEPLNPALKGTPPVPEKSDEAMDIGAAPTHDRHRRRRRWCYVDPRRWFEHQNLRDERAEAFQTLLWEGSYSYVYHCRATTAGDFVAPAAKAEEMYSPEIFGRSAVDRVRVSAAQAPRSVRL